MYKLGHTVPHFTFLGLLAEFRAFLGIPNPWAVGPGDFLALALAVGAALSGRRWPPLASTFHSTKHSSVLTSPVLDSSQRHEPASNQEETIEPLWRIGKTCPACPNNSASWKITPWGTILV